MKIIRRRVRSAFLWAAISFIGVIIIAAGHPELAEKYNSFVYSLALSVCGLLAVLYTAAYLTTRKPSPYRNNWAVAASSLSLVWGCVMAYAIYQYIPSNPRAEVPALISIVVSVAGLYLYAPGGSPAKPESATTSPATTSTPTFKAAVSSPLPQPAPRRSFSAPTAVAASMASVSYSSPELALAAAGPVDPDAPWDPLQFMRSPETIQKLRS